jgi:amino acid transporter
MSSSLLEPLNRTDVLDVMFDGHVRAASTLLFAIESRTAHLVAQSRQAMERFLTEETAEERELAFLEALALGRDPPIHPTIQDFERYAPEWASLVPKNPGVQAALVRLFSQEYALTHKDIPGIRAALALDESEVQQAYQRLYRQPLDRVFVDRAPLAERLRWMWAALAKWLESLPAFWTTFALTLTETVGAGILALPIALADVGPLPGVAILAVMGLVNVLTIAYMAEAVSRSGTIRYGNAFLGRLVTDYLGPFASAILLVGLTIECVLTLWPFFIGFSTTLSDATRIIPAPVWAAVLFLILLYFLQHKTLNATIASALVIGIINISLILILALLTFTRLQPANLTYVNVPFLGGRPFEPSILQLIFGIVLLAYFGHLSVSNCARVVLHRDPSARALIWGAVVAQGIVMLLYCVWVLAVNGAIAPHRLADETGTALTPLAEELGPVVYVLGSVFVLLGMGIGSLHSSLPLYNLVRERLPTKRWTVVLLPRQRGRLLLRNSQRQRGADKTSVRLGLTYLGLESPTTDHSEGQPRFLLDANLDGRAHRLEIAVRGRWDVSALFDQLPVLRQHSIPLALEILDASQAHVRLRISSPLRLTYEGDWYAAGLGIADLLTQSDSQRQILTWMLRQSVTGQETMNLAEVVAFTGLPQALARHILSQLVGQGYIQAMEVDGEVRYEPCMEARRARQLPEQVRQAWEKQEALIRDGPEGRVRWRIGGLLLGKQVQFLLSVAPVAAIFFLAEWLLFIGEESFSEPLSFLGVIVISLLGGTFPVLLLIASRRKGDILPGTVFRTLGHPVIAIGIYLLFLANLFVHGLVIWENPVERAVALAVGLLIIGSTIYLVRRGTFTSRLVVELQDDLRERGRATFAVTSGGRPAVADVRLDYTGGEQRVRAASGEVSPFSELRHAHFHLPATRARELKIWAHRIAPDGNSEALPGLLTLHNDGLEQQFDLRLSGGQVLVPIAGSACQFNLNFAGR